MTAGAILSDKALALKGKESPVAVYEVTEEAVRSFVQAVEHPHPYYLDRKEAEKGPYGGMIAPPTFIHHAFSYAIAEDNIYSLIPRDPLSDDLVKEIDFTALLYGGTEIELFHPIRVGDVLTITHRIADLYEKPGSTGSLAFCIYESSYTNQLGQLAAKEQYTYIYRK